MDDHSYSQCEDPDGVSKRRGLGSRTGYALGAALLLVLCWYGTPCGAAGEKQVLGLQELIRRAVSVSPEIAQRRSEMAAARSDLAQARAAYLPQLETLMVAGPINNTRRPEVAGKRIIDPSADLSVGAFGRLDVTLVQPIYTFGKLSNSREAAEKGVAASRARQNQTGNEIALRVKELYYALILSRTGIEAAREADEYFDEARKRISRLLDSGATNVMESDLYRVDAYRADIVRFQAEAQKGKNVAYFGLKSMIGMPDDADFDTADKSLSFQGGTLDKPAPYIQKALAQRPELRALEEGIAARKSLAEAARSDLYPTFFAAGAGSAAGAPGRQTLHNPYIYDDFNHLIGGFVAGMKWHFDFGLTRARIEKAHAEYNTLVQTRAVAHLGIPIQVAKHFEEARQWRVSIDAYRSAASASRKWIVSAMSSFDMGTGTADDLLRGIERYGQNHGKYLEALFNYNLSLAQLDYDTGASDW
jgi:outer membrane protein TolC